MGKVIAQQLLLILQQLTFQSFCDRLSCSKSLRGLDGRRQQSRKVPRWVGSPTFGIHNHRRTIIRSSTWFSCSKVLIPYFILFLLALTQYWSLNLLYFVNFDFRIFLSYQSRQILLETELGSSSEPANICGCPSSDGSNLGASDPHCPFVRKRELIQLFLWVLVSFFLLLLWSFDNSLFWTLFPL